MILNVHGYHSAAEFDVTVAENSAYRALRAAGFEAVSPAINYDIEKPENIIERLETAAKESGARAIVGTSLGGFFASVLSARTGLPVVLVNPCLLPFLHLPRLGFEGDIRPFMRLFPEIADIPRENVSVIVGGKDEIIDSHDMTQRLFDGCVFKIVPDGKHSGSTLPLEGFFKETMK